MYGYPGIEPGRRIAETLANVFSPANVLLHGSGCGQKRQFPYRCGLAELAPGAAFSFAQDDFSVTCPVLIPEPGPDEVKNLMYQNQAQQLRTGKQIAVKNDMALTNETGGVDLRAPIQRAGK